MEFISNHLTNESEIGSNRTISKRIGKVKRIVNVRYMKHPFTSSYLTFKHKDKISFSSFIKYKGKV